MGKYQSGPKRGLIILAIVAAGILLGVIISILLLGKLTGKSDSSSEASSSAAVSSAPLVTPPVSTVPASEPAPVSQPPASSESVSSSQSQSEPEKQAAPAVKDGFNVSLSGNTASVTFKTDVPSTVNAILVTSPEVLTISQFYDHFTRGVKYESAVSQKAIFKVDENGVTETFELPDLSKNYYLLINAVENETGTWQPNVTLIPLHTAGGSASSSSSSSQQ